MKKGYILSGIWVAVIIVAAVLLPSVALECQEKVLLGEVNIAVVETADFDMNRIYAPSFAERLALFGEADSVIVEMDFERGAELYYDEDMLTERFSNEIETLNQNGLIPPATAYAVLDGSMEFNYTYLYYISTSKFTSAFLCSAMYSGANGETVLLYMDAESGRIIGYIIYQGFKSEEFLWLEDGFASGWAEYLDFTLLDELDAEALFAWCESAAKTESSEWTDTETLIKLFGFTSTAVFQSGETQVIYRLRLNDGKNGIPVGINWVPIGTAHIN